MRHVRDLICGVEFAGGGLQCVAVAAEQCEGSTILRQTTRDRQSNALGTARDESTARLCHMMIAMSPSRFNVRSSCALPGEVLFGPRLFGVAKFCRGVQREMGVGQMGPGKGAQIRTARRDDGVQMIRLGDVADCHRGNADLVADAVGEWRLEHAAIDRFCLDRCLAGGYVHQIDTRVLEGTRDQHRIVRRDAAFYPVGGGDPHRHWLVRGPNGAHGA